MTHFKLLPTQFCLLALGRRKRMKTHSWSSEFHTSSLTCTGLTSYTSNFILGLSWHCRQLSSLKKKFQWLALVLLLVISIFLALQKKKSGINLWRTCCQTKHANIKLVFPHRAYFCCLFHQGNTGGDNILHKKAFPELEFPFTPRAQGSYNAKLVLSARSSLPEWPFPCCMTLAICSS